MGTGDFVQYITFEKRYSPHTIRAYQTDLDNFSNFISEQYNITSPEEIDHHMIRSWMVDLIEQGQTVRSVNRKLSALKSYYRFLVKEGKVSTNPLSKIIAPKISGRLPQFVENDKIDLLLNEVDFDNKFEDSRNKLILEMFYATGMRLSELVNIKETDIDLNNSTIKVLGKRNKERLIPLSLNLIELLNNYMYIKQKEIAGPDVKQYLFVTSKGKKIYNKLVYRIVNKYLSLVTTLTKRSPHVLRHTFATHLLNQGADLNAIKEILGHANLSATQVYTHNTIGQLKSIHQSSHPREKLK